MNNDKQTLELSTRSNIFLRRDDFRTRLLFEGVLSVLGVDEAKLNSIEELEIEPNYVCATDEDANIVAEGQQ